jgi:hypothetical protein
MALALVRQARWLDTWDRYRIPLRSGWCGILKFCTVPLGVVSRPSPEPSYNDQDAPISAVRDPLDTSLGH